jgi:hypothetical protein
MDEQQAKTVLVPGPDAGWDAFFRGQRATANRGGQFSPRREDPAAQEPKAHFFKALEPAMGHRRLFRRTISKHLQDMI